MTLTAIVNRRAFDVVVDLAHELPVNNGPNSEF